MKHKDKLAIFDLDGTLFETKNVNFKAYSKALEICGINIEIDYKYYCDFCNGNSYKVFLPRIVSGITSEMMRQIHDNKKRLYKEYLNYARKNNHLFFMIELMKKEYQVAVVTTASRANTEDILQTFDEFDTFDFILTKEDVTNTKPDPECFLKAISRAGVKVDNTIIFEDSETGLKAAEVCGANYVKVYGYN